MQAGRHASFTYYIMRMRTSAVAIDVNKQTENVCIKCKQSYKTRYIASFIKLHVCILTVVILMHFTLSHVVCGVCVFVYCCTLQVEMLEKDQS